MNYLNDWFELRPAEAKDSGQILKIYESEEFGGNISVIYTRRPNPYLSLLEEGELVFLFVLFDHKEDMVCGAGGCVIRNVFIEGKIKTAGYLTGLKLLPQYRKKVPYIANAYQFMHEQTKDLADCYYTTILIENTPAQRLLEKRRKNMPVYDLKGIYTVFCLSTGIRAAKKNYILECGNMDRLEAFYSKNASGWSLFPSDFSMGSFPKDAVYTLRDESGDIIAACALWNQQAHKQYIVTNYKGIYKYLQWFPLKWFGYPNLPRRGQIANCADYHMLCVKDGNADAAIYFIEKIAERESRYDFLMLGLFENHYLISHLQRIKHIKYQSKFYEVNWDDSPTVLTPEKLHIDVGLL
jgi:hypothetical protein